MGEVTRHEGEWQAKATAAAIEGARKVALSFKGAQGIPATTQVGRLTETQWGWIVTGAIFGWVRTRCEQAIAEGFDQENAGRMTGLSPPPCDVAVVTSILPALADQAGIDWSLPLAAWTQDTMINFLMLVWDLTTKAETMLRVMTMMTQIPEGMKARAILADPGIAFRTYSAKGEGRSPQRHYRCDPIEELAKLPVSDFAAPDCFLFLWIPPRSVYLTKPLMEAWGFKFSGKAFCWVKQNKRGPGWFMGNGYGTRHNTEDCWLGRRGKPQRKSMGVRELIVAPIRGHSRKPDEIYERIEALCDRPYLELFARQQRPGWVCVGNESAKFPAEAA
jgi:N6-adenosine-specific RNA methylase IME4